MRQDRAESGYEQQGRGLEFSGEPRNECQRTSAPALVVRAGILLPAHGNGWLLDHERWLPGVILSIALTAWVAYAMARNVGRLWRLREATRGVLIGLAVVVIVFALCAATMVYAANNAVVATDEDKHIPLAIAYAGLSGTVLAIAVRALGRTRNPSHVAS